jgi:Fe-S cluster biogenesis protein NfuA
VNLAATLRRVFGVQPTLTPRDAAAPLELTPAARGRLAALPVGHGVHLETIEAGRGRAVQLLEGESLGPPPPGFDGLPITASDADLSLLSGRTIDWRDGRWAVDVAFELRARETPNPDSRLYLSDRVWCVGRPAFFVAGAEAPEPAAALLAIDGVRSILLRDATVTVERDPDVRWDALDAAVDHVLREHLRLCGGPVAADASQASGSAFEDEIRAVLAERILPAIHKDGGDLELLGVSEGVVKVSMVGACRSCPSSSATLHSGVERALREAFGDRFVRVEQVS